MKIKTGGSSNVQNLDKSNDQWQITICVCIIEPFLREREDKSHLFGILRKTMTQD